MGLAPSAVPAPFFFVVTFTSSKDAGVRLPSRMIFVRNSCRFISENISKQLFVHMANRADGNLIDEF